EPAARMPDQMDRAVARTEGRDDRVEQARGPRPQRGRGGRLHRVHPRVEAEGGAVLGEEPVDVPEVAQLPEVREAEEPGHEVDAIGRQPRHLTRPGATDKRLRSLP